ncbi:MAG: glycoside hydrolase family 3 C-terminal domain-containing protein [Dehalococcoidales bacterium]|nr:glycoside hydrolase family 3 C-terminal domain-containing protein [Dehalococcoidales bacterium]
MEAYRDSSATIDVRVSDLLGRMTLDEKLAQIGGVFASRLMENEGFSAERALSAIPNGIGHISAAGRSSGLSPDKLATLNNDIQRFLIENTRLGIPAIIHEECLNGLRAIGATIFPQNIGLASTWDTDLINRITGTVRQQMRAAGFHQGLAPVLDIARDPRWGRIEETFGEDPYLVGEMGKAYVKGLQGDDIRCGIISTLKHFAGHGLPEGGLNCAPSHIPPRLLREVYLYPFLKAIKEGGALSVMNAYHEIDGIPCGASEWLLSEILRDEWGFEGVVVSDYFSISQLATLHRVCEESTEAAALALAAGIDVELPESNCYSMSLKHNIENGTIPHELIDRAAARILRLKFLLGLFDNPLVETGCKTLVLDTGEQRALALEAARKSIVLLKNDNNLLPLSRDIGTIAVIGPSADDCRNLLGDYTYPAGAGYEFEIDGASGTFTITWKAQHSMAAREGDPFIVSILEGMKKLTGKNSRIIFARGCDVTGVSMEGIPEAIEAVKAADVAIVAAGGKSGMLPEYTCGEMRDRVELGLPGVQERLLKALYDTGTPIILVLINGRPYTLNWLAKKIPAIVEAWLPGEEGGQAVADVIFGEYNPGGKLPVSFPEKEGQLPVYYAHKPSGRKSSLWGDYADCSVLPRFEFGYGLSYTTFSFSNLRIKPEHISSDGCVRISTDVKNTGNRSGDEVVQLYVNDIVASVTRPVKELKGFRRIHLQPGEKRTVEFNLPATDLAFYGKNMEKTVEPGVFKVMVGRSAADIVLEGQFEVDI